MKITTLLSAIIFPVITFGLHQRTEAPIYDHLMEVNENWKFQDKSKFEAFVSFDKDLDRIQKHLFLE
jgi:hypothetical protein